MKRFIRKILFLILAVFFIPVLILLTISPQHTHGYNAALIDKINRLESIHEPKIMLVSDSNIAFGIKSELMEKEFSMPVVNLGLHGGLGHVFHERLPLFNLGKGDIVVLSHLSYDDNDTILSPELALVAVENHFHLWKIFRLKDYPAVFCMLPRYAYKCLARFVKKEDVEPSEPECYARSSFNEYGDNVFPRGAGEEAPACTRYPSVNDCCIKRINDFCRYCRKKGAVIVISGAPIVCGLPDFQAQYYKNFQSDLERKVDCPVISDFSDYFFGKEYFYGGAFHMTNEGAELRTKQLVIDLRKFLDERKAGSE